MHHRDDDQKDIIALVCFISIFASTGGLYVVMNGLLDKFLAWLQSIGQTIGVVTPTTPEIDPASTTVPQPSGVEITFGIPHILIVIAFAVLIGTIVHYLVHTRRQNRP